MSNLIKKIDQEVYATLDDIDAVVIVADSKGDIIYANQAVKRILGYEPEEIYGSGWWKLFGNEDELEERKAVIAGMAKGTIEIDARNLYQEAVKTKHGKEVWLQWTNRRSLDGHIVGLAHDITSNKSLEEELFGKNRENELLLKEIHHRVKNNLQIITSLIKLQFADIKDPTTSQAMRDTIDRIQSMSLIHTKLYESQNLASIDFGSYVEDLFRFINRGYATRGQVEIKIDVKNIELDVDLAINLGLIVTELITNAYKHAFPENRAGTISLTALRESPNLICLVIQDDGLGFEPISPKAETSLGFSLVSALVEQIDGFIVTESTNGTKHTIKFDPSPQG